MLQKKPGTVAVVYLLFLMLIPFGWERHENEFSQVQPELNQSYN
jgi:hypothetical protein